jgi:hypothetical protein
MKKRLGLVLAGLMILVFAVGYGFSATSADNCSVSRQLTLNCLVQGGSRWVVGSILDIVSGGGLHIKSGGSLVVDSGATFTQNGSTVVGVTGFTQPLVICGDDAGTTTVNYLGPSLPSWTGDGTDYSLASTACSALDSTTEATADLPVSTLALGVRGMRCKSNSTQAAGESLTMTVRTAAADTVPVISCVIGEAATECRTNTATTTNIVAGATLAVKVVPVGNNSAGAVQCVVTMVMP